HWQFQRSVHIHSGTKRTVGISNHSLYHDVTTVRADPWLYGGDPASKAASGPGVRRQAHRSADLDARQILLRHGEMGIEPVHRRQADDRVARIKILAKVDAAHTQVAGDRRNDPFLGDAGVQLPDRSQRLIVLGPPLVEHFA